MGLWDSLSAPTLALRRAACETPWMILHDRPQFYTRTPTEQLLYCPSEACGRD